MIKTYEYEYDCGEATASFQVDTEVFTEKHAQDTLGFFSWNFDEENDPIDEVMKKYALEAIRMATINNHNISGVKRDFDNLEGFYNIDGKYGITLIYVEGLEFKDHLLDIKKD